MTKADPGAAVQDVIVLGAGPAGCVAAHRLARAGAAVALVAPNRPVAQRVETLPANGALLAESLGLSRAVQAAALGDIAEVRLNWRDVPEIMRHDSAPPLAVDRVLLHLNLKRLAVGAGARLIAGHARDIQDRSDMVEVTLDDSILRARVVIDARGARAARTRAHRAQKATGLPATIALPFRARLKTPEDSPFMAVDALKEGWIWSCALPRDGVSGALFVPPDTLAGADADARQAILRAHLDQTTGLQTAALSEVGAPVDARFASASCAMPTDRVIRCGDALLARDPIASHGLVHAFRTGVQAATGAATLLDPLGDPSAVGAFLERSHKDAAETALDATRSAYASQNRFETAFWSVPASAPASTEPSPAPRPATSEIAAETRLRFCARSERAAILTDRRIEWTEALHFPNSAGPVAFVAGLPAAQLPGLLTEPGPLAHHAARLGRAAPMAQVNRVLASLIDFGAFVPDRN